MMKTKIVLATGIAALALSASVLAETNGRYAIEGIVGKTYQGNYLIGEPTISEYASSQGIRGTVTLTNHLGFEVSYFDYGRAESSYVDEFDDLITNTLDTSSASVGLRGDIPLSRIVSLVGRLGISMWEFSFSETDSAFPGDIYRDDDQGVDGYVGVGLQMNLDNNLRLSIEYMEFDFAPVIGAANTDHRVETVSLSAGIRF